jgi:hypothetical protein
MINKKKIIFFLGIIIVFLLMVLFLMIRPGSNKKIANTSPTITPTQFESNEKFNEIKITKTDPSDNDENVIPSSSIFLIFKNPLTDENKKLISIFTTPDFSFDYDWSKDNTLRIKPKTDLQQSNKYTVSVNYNQSKIYGFSFTTSEFTSEEAYNQINSQIADDIKFTQETAKFKSENPWFSKLPLKGDNYLVVYDGINKKFAIGINESLSTQDRENAINLAVGRIKEIYPNLTENDYYIPSE